MVQSKRMTRSRTTAARDSPRPRRKAATRAAATISETPTRPVETRSASGWNETTGPALVGSTVGVWWPDEERFYTTIVLAYHPRKRQHKIIYLEDESIESVDLGDGPDQRAWERRPQPTNPLIGKDLVFAKDDGEDENWFDFMRAPREKRTGKFAVKVLSKLETDPEPEEVCSPFPKDDSGEHKYYRVIYAANEYLATVDLAHVVYHVEGTDHDDEIGIDLTTSQLTRSALPPDTRRNGAQITREEPDLDAEDAADDDDDAKDDAYVPPAESDDDADVDDDKGKNVHRGAADVSDDEEEAPMRKAPRGRKAALMKTEGRTRATRKPAAVNNADKFQPEEDIIEKVTKHDPDEDEDRVVADVRNEIVADAEPELDALPGLEDEPVPEGPDVDGIYRASDGDFVADQDQKSKPVVKRGRDGGSKDITTDYGSGVVKDPHSGMDVAPVVEDVAPDDTEPDIAKAGSERAGSRTKGEGSIGTQDTRDEPLDDSAPKTRSRVPPPMPASLYPRKFEDEEAHDTASDEEKLGWVSKDQKRQASRAGGSKSQVGDYISVDTPNGPRRKAFVEAYLPGNDEHFVAFCDAEGGNMQVKLTKSNHTILKDEEVDELNRKTITADAPGEVADGNWNGYDSKPRGKRRRNGANSTLNEGRKKRRQKGPEIKGDSAGPEVCGRCLKIEWPGSDYVYTALVMGYNSKTGEHLVVYLSDHCVETVTLKYRDWNLIAREDEPWLRQGMVGKRLYVFWDAEYTEDPRAQERAEELFGQGNTRVPYEAYVISYEGDGHYKVLYPATEDTETRTLKAEESEGDEVDFMDKDWDILDQGTDEINGLPIVTWSE